MWTAAPSERVRWHACLNAAYETGFLNPLDEAIRTHCVCDLTGHRKLDEVPYDFLRKRLSRKAAARFWGSDITSAEVTSWLQQGSAAEAPWRPSIPNSQAVMARL